MNWLKLFGAANSEGGARDPIDDFWYQPLSAASSAGVVVTHDTAIRISTALACIKVISQAAAQLPLGVFQRETNGDKTPRPNNPLYTLLHDAPNGEHTAMEWREMMTAWAVARGTAYSEIVPGARGAISELIPIHPDTIKPIAVRDGTGRTRWQWEIKETGAAPRRLLRDELFILRALAVKRDTPEGLDPITEERDSFGAALAAQDYGNRFFANDARPSGILKPATRFKDEDALARFKRGWRAAFGRAGRHGTAVLEPGMEYQQIGLTNEQAQFLETRGYLDVDICRIFGVQPHKVGILDRATFSNIEQQSIAFVTDTLMPWLVRWEQAIKRDLVVQDEVFAEHNVSALLRGDTESRYAAYAIGRNWGWLSANDVRRLENMNSIGEQGDVYLQPSNMFRAGEPGEPSRSLNERNGNATRVNGEDSEDTVWLPN